MRGALSLVALVAGERKPPHVAGMHLTTPRGPFLHLDHSRIAAKRCHYNSGGYMTLAELGMAFWHDLAAPVIAGIGSDTVPAAGGDESAPDPAPLPGVYLVLFSLEEKKPG